jgi:hypothetical protein
MITMDKIDILSINRQINKGAMFTEFWKEASMGPFHLYDIIDIKITLKVIMSTSKNIKPFKISIKTKKE